MDKITIQSYLSQLKRAISKDTFLSLEEKLNIGTAIFIKLIVILLFIGISYKVYQNISSNAIVFGSVSIPTSIEQNYISKSSVENAIIKSINKIRDLDGNDNVGVKESLSENQYNSLSKDNNDNLQFAGIGFSLQSLTDLIVDFFNIHQNKITLDFINYKEKKIDIITSVGDKMFTSSLPISSGQQIPDVIMELVQSSAEFITEQTDPILAGIYYMRVKDYDTLENIAKKLILSKKEDEKYWGLLFLAKAKLQNGNFDKAINYCNQALSINKNLFMCYNIINQSYFGQKNYESANQILNDMLAIKQMAWGYNNLAFNQNFIGNTGEALDNINKAIKLEPQSGILYTTLAEIQESIGNKKEFFDNIDIAISLGFDWDLLRDENPYKKYLNDEELIKIVEKHGYEI